MSLSDERLRSVKHSKLYNDELDKKEKARKNNAKKMEKTKQNKRPVAPPPPRTPGDDARYTPADSEYARPPREMSVAYSPPCGRSVDHRRRFISWTTTTAVLFLLPRGGIRRPRATVVRCHRRGLAINCHCHHLRALVLRATKNDLHASALHRRLHDRRLVLRAMKNSLHTTAVHPRRGTMSVLRATALRRTRPMAARMGLPPSGDGTHGLQTRRSANEWKVAE